MHSSGIKDKTILVVCDKDSLGERVDRFLCRRCDGFSRSYIQHLISSGFVRRNDVLLKKANYQVKQGDRIEVSFPEVLEVAAVPKDVLFDIVGEQSGFVVVNKPAGLLVHPAASDPEAVTLVHGLLYKFKELDSFDNKERPGIVHRLDKNTSGLLVVARQRHAQAELSDLFKNRKVHKTYLAVVNGHPDREGTIDLPVGRHPVERHKMSHVSYEGREALTTYRVLAYYKDCTLVAATIHTGRTHQIRVHFAAIGHGLMGDCVYGKVSKMINRQALHSWKLSFEYLGCEYSYCVPVPEDFFVFLKSLKR